MINRLRDKTKVISRWILAGYHLQKMKGFILYTSFSLCLFSSVVLIIPARSYSFKINAVTNKNAGIYLYQHKRIPIVIRVFKGELR